MTNILVYDDVKANFDSLGEYAVCSVIACLKVKKMKSMQTQFVN